MKFTANQVLEFTPVTVTIVLESKVELDAFGAIANHVSLTNAFRDIGLDLGRAFRALEGVGANLDVNKLHDALRLRIL